MEDHHPRHSTHHPRHSREGGNPDGERGRPLRLRKGTRASEARSQGMHRDFVMRCAIMGCNDTDY